MADQLLQCFPGDDDAALAGWLDKTYHHLSRTKSRTVDAKLADLLVHIYKFKPILKVTRSSLLRSVVWCAVRGHARSSQALANSSLLRIDWPYNIPLGVSRTFIARSVLDSPEDQCLPKLDDLIQCIAPPIYCIDNIVQMIIGCVGDNSLASLISLTSRLISTWLVTEGDWRIARLLAAICRVWNRLWPGVPPPFPSTLFKLLSSPTTLKRIEAEDLENADEDVRVTLAAFPEWFAMSLFTFRPVIPSVILSTRSTRAQCQKWLMDSFSPDVNISEFIRTGSDAAVAVGVLLVPVSDVFAQYDHWPYDRLMTAVEHWIDIAPDLPKADPNAGLDRLIHALRIASQSVTSEYVVSAGVIRERAAALWTESDQ